MVSWTGFGHQAPENYLYTGCVAIKHLLLRCCYLVLLDGINRLNDIIQFFVRASIHFWILNT